MGAHQTTKVLHSKRSMAYNSKIAEWEKIFALNTAGKGLLSRVYKVLTKINPTNINSKQKMKRENEYTPLRMTNRWPKGKLKMFTITYLYH